MVRWETIDTYWVTDQTTRASTQLRPGWDLGECRMTRTFEGADEAGRVAKNVIRRDPESRS